MSSILQATPNFSTFVRHGEKWPFLYFADVLEYLLQMTIGKNSLFYPFIQSKQTLNNSPPPPPQNSKLVFVMSGHWRVGWWISIWVICWHIPDYCVCLPLSTTKQFFFCSEFLPVQKWTLRAVSSLQVNGCEARAASKASFQPGGFSGGWRWSFSAALGQSSMGGFLYHTDTKYWKTDRSKKTNWMYCYEEAKHCK